MYGYLLPYPILIYICIELFDEMQAQRFSAVALSPNRISKTQTFTDLHNYLTSSVIFYILPIQNKWLKCKK